MKLRTMVHSLLVAGLLATCLLAADTPATKPAAGAPVNKFCPINPANEIDPKVTTVYNDKTIGFCCDDCIPEFKKDPEKYMKILK